MGKTTPSRSGLVSRPIDLHGVFDRSSRFERQGVAAYGWTLYQSSLRPNPAALYSGPASPAFRFHPNCSWIAMATCSHVSRHLPVSSTPGGFDFVLCSTGFRARPWLVRLRIGIHTLNDVRCPHRRVRLWQCSRSPGASPRIAWFSATLSALLTRKGSARREGAWGEQSPKVTSLRSFEKGSGGHLQNGANGEGSALIAWPSDYNGSLAHTKSTARGAVGG
jgi:hypothetical protein